MRFDQDSIQHTHLNESSFDDELNSYLDGYEEVGYIQSTGQEIYKNKKGNVLLYSMKDDITLESQDIPEKYLHRFNDLKTKFKQFIDLSGPVKFKLTVNPNGSSRYYLKGNDWHYDASYVGNKYVWERVTRQITKSVRYPGGNTVAIYYKDKDNESWHKYDKGGYCIYYKDNNSERFGEVEYNDKGRAIYYKDAQTSNEEWWDYDKSGKCIGYRNSYDQGFTQDEHGNELDVAAVTKAKEYNRMYHGLFLHTRTIDSLDDFIQPSKEVEVCVSTVRSNYFYGFSVYGNRIILIGFGHISQLFDWDAFSNDSNPGGRRIKTNNIPQSSKLHDIDYENFRLVHNEDEPDLEGEFDITHYYDEGFMYPSSAEVVIAVIPDVQKLVLTSDERHQAIIKLKRRYPHIKILTLQQFEVVRTTEQLLTMVYNAKQDVDVELNRQEELGMYDEKVLPTFKEYLLSK